MTPALVNALEQFIRLDLVIESAVRNSDPVNHTAVLAAIVDGRRALAEYRAAPQGWQPIETAPKDGTRVLIWVCTRGSIRRGHAEICVWGKHNDWGPIWLRHNGKEVVDLDAATYWMPLPIPPEVNHD